ncbi:MAG: type II toxin-antitoxin system RelB family antitoxin [Pseudohongiellaceae bacterium]
MFAFQIPTEIEKRLDALVKRNGRTKVYYAEQAILQGIEDLEDAHTAEERLKEGGKIWDQEDLERGIDLES